MSRILKLLTSTFLLLAFVLQPLSASASGSKTTNEESVVEHIESFEVKNLSDQPNEDGFYEELGTKVVNSITNVKKGNNKIETEISAVEDLYDVKGNYVKTVVTMTQFENDYVTGKGKSKKIEKEFKNKKATKEKKNKEVIKNNVLESTKNFDLNSLEPEVVKGFTYEQINEVKEKMLSIQQDQISTQGAYSCGSYDCAGAFDTYYNYNLTTGGFTVQALSATGHKYVKITGSTIGSSKNAASLNKFKGYVNNYEQTIIDQMNYDYGEISWDWWKSVMGLIGLVIGYGTGPVGWVEIVVYYTGALATFQDLTDASYGTYQMLTLSKTAAQYNQNARNMLNYTNWEKYSSSLVSGY